MCKGQNCLGFKYIFVQWRYTSDLEVDIHNYDSFEVVRNISHWYLFSHSLHGDSSWAILIISMDVVKFFKNDSIFYKSKRMQKKHTHKTKALCNIAKVNVSPNFR